METHTQPKFVRWALLAGIVIILNVFFSVVVALAYPTPQYDAFCPHQDISPTDSKTCVAQGGQWTEYSPAPEQVSGPKMSGYCDMYAKCQKPYETAQKQHSLYAFVIMTVLGVIALIVGFVPLGSSILSSGLSYGGVVALVIGSAQYWGDAGNWIRLAISTVGLLALLFIAWRKFRD
jgi:hypothetical protein